MSVGRPTALQYWSVICSSATAHAKGLRSATTLIAWNMWKEWNTRVFNNTLFISSVLMEEIKEEGREWI
jgi:hypothetical protein